jgi:hypothetical protein
MYGFESNQSSWEAGKIGNAIRFDGVDDFMTLPASISNAYTISMWLKTTTDAGDGNASDWNGQPCLVAGPENTSGLFLANGKFRIWSGVHDKIRMATMSQINHDSWLHLCASRQSNNHHFKIYINGSLDKTSGGGQGTGSSTGALLHLGRTQTGSTFYQGLMDELYVYARTLTATEVQDLYDLGQ